MTRPTSPPRPVNASASYSPGEQAVRVLHPEAVTGSDSESQKTEDSSSSNKKVLPWYSELSYSPKRPMSL